MGPSGEELETLGALLRVERGVIVAGVRTTGSGELTASERTAVLDLAELTGWPVLADHLSGVRSDHRVVVGTFDALLRDAPTAQRLRPDAVLRIGGLLASRVTNEWLVGSGAAQIGVDRWGSCPDPDRTLTMSVRADVGDLCRRLGDSLDADPTRHGAAPRSAWLEQWIAAESAARQAIVSHMAGEPGAASTVLEMIPDGSVLVVSSSMPVRDLEWYAPPRSEVRVVANRGANGIDGVVSTAVGIAAAGLRTACLIGDVAFLHDSNALVGLAARGVDVMIVVIDNNGGGIFSFLPQAEALDTERFEQLFGTPHGVDLATLVGAHGLRVERVADEQALGEVLSDWGGRGTRVVIVASDRDSNVEVHHRLNESVAEALARPGG